MAIPFLNNIDLNENQLLNAKVHTDTTAPSNPGTGSMWFDTNTNVNLLKIYRGGSWTNLFVKAEAIADSGTNLATADQIHTFVTAGSLTLTNKTIDVDDNTVSNIEVDNLKSGVLDTDISSVAGTDTTLASAKAIKTYVDAQVTAQDLDFQGDSGGALSIDLDSETLTIAGDTGITTTGSGNTINIDLDNTASDMTATNSGVYGSATAIPVITVDRQGRLTAASTAAISTTLTVDGDSGTQDVSLATDDLQILGTTGEIDVAVTKASTDVKATIGLADTITGDRTFSNDVTISGGLTVVGTTTTNNVETVSTSNGVVFEGTTADGHDGTLKSVVAGADVTYTLPNVTGYVALFSADPSTTTVTATPAELNLLDGSIAGTIVNSKCVVYGSSGQVNATTLQIAGTSITSSAAELNILNGVTSDATELNILDGATLSTTELNYVNGVTSAIQTQLDTKQTAANVGTLIDARSSAHTITGDGSDTDFTIDYGFTAAAVNDVIIQVVDSYASSSDDGDTVFTEVERHSTSQCKIKFATAPANNHTYRVLCFKVA